jgi:nicotinamidase-related amidase
MELNTQNTALLVMDMQAGTLAHLSDTTALVSNIAKAIANARSKQIPVFYVTVGFRQGAPEISRNNKGFSAAKERFLNVDMNEFTKIHADLAPLPNELTVMKRRISAFAGSDLEVILRAFNIQHMVLTGVATSGVVLSTTREAADKDYQLTILADCCADGDEEVHRVLTTKILARQADVITVEEWCKM